MDFFLKNSKELLTAFKVKEVIILSKLPPKTPPFTPFNSYGFHAFYQDLTKVLHLWILDDLREQRNDNVLYAYGTVYHFAWTLASDETRKMLEEVCIQDILYR